MLKRKLLQEMPFADDMLMICKLLKEMPFAVEWAFQTGLSFFFHWGKENYTSFLKITTCWGLPENIQVQYSIEKCWITCSTYYSNTHVHKTQNINLMIIGSRRKKHNNYLGRSGLPLETTSGAPSEWNLDFESLKGMPLYVKTCPWLAGSWCNLPQVRSVLNWFALD